MWWNLFQDKLQLLIPKSVRLSVEKIKYYPFDLEYLLELDGRIETIEIKGEKDELHNWRFCNDDSDALL